MFECIRCVCGGGRAVESCVYLFVYHSKACQKYFVHVLNSGWVCFGFKPSWAKEVSRRRHFTPWLSVKSTPVENMGGGHYNAPLLSDFPRR